MAKLTQGTHLYVINTLASGGSAVVKIECPTAFSYSGAPVDQIEVTCLDELDAHKYKAGLKNPGNATISIDIDPDKPSHMVIYDLYAESESVTTEWAIGFSGDETAPTIASDGTWNLPTSRDWLTFTGYVSDLPIDFALNSVAKSDIPLQISGKPVITKATA